MAFARNLYDNAVLVSLRAPGASGIRSDERIRVAAATHLGIDPKGMTGAKVVIPKEWLKPITNPVSTFRFHLREVGVPWSSNNAAEKSRKEDGKWLVYQKDLPELETVARQCRMDREVGVQELVANIDDIKAELKVTEDPDDPTKLIIDGWA